MHRSHAVILALSLLAIGGIGLTAREDRTPFALAILRRDGILVPFAVSEGNKWSSPWPIPKFKLEAPIAFSDIPRDWWGRVAPAETWTAWPIGSDPRAVHVIGPVVFSAHCLSNIGLRTDYKSAEPLAPADQEHQPKDGVATTGSATIGAVEILSESAPEWKTALPLVEDAIRKAETKAADTDWWDRMYGWRAQRDKTPLKLEVLCRSKGPTSGSTVYYFEAAREFGPPPRGSIIAMGPEQGRPVPGARAFSGLHIFSQGFFVVSGKTAVRDSVVSTFTNTDRDDVDYGLPLGTITIGNRVNWIMHWSGRGRERYTILEIDDKAFRRVVDVPGGAC